MVMMTNGNESKPKRFGPLEIPSTKYGGVTASFRKGATQGKALRGVFFKGESIAL
jgi:hypothetical protein